MFEILFFMLAVIRLFSMSFLTFPFCIFYIGQRSAMDDCWFAHAWRLKILSSFSLPLIPLHLWCIQHLQSWMEVLDGITTYICFSANSTRKPSFCWNFSSISTNRHSCLLHIYSQHVWLQSFSQSFQSSLFQALQVISIEQFFWTSWPNFSR